MQYPDWLIKAKESKKLLQWIQDPVHSFKTFHGRLLLKCQEEDCIVFYAVDSKEKDCLQLKEPKLCGVLYLPDYFLYEVDTAFYEAGWFFQKADCRNGRAFSGGSRGCPL